MIANPDQNFWGQFEQAPDQSQGGISFDPSQAAPSSPMQGGGGMTAPNMPGSPGWTGGFMGTSSPSYGGAQLGGPGGPMTPQTNVGSYYSDPAAPGGGGVMAAPQGGQVPMQQFNDAWLQSPYPGTVDGLKQFMAAHPEYAQAGITLGGSKGDKVYGPGGSFWGDAVIAAGEGGKGKSGMSGPPAGGGGLGSNLGSLGYSFGDAMTPFKPPTAEDALNSPGLKFALEEANRMGQNSGAARGTLLNGRFQQALQASNVQNALQGYQGVHDRAYQTHTRNQDAPWNKNLQLGELGYPK